ncbi:FlgK family flagellar hook-associated protein [Vibrio alginolyticus]|uniref:FlgK family flagellar hook-associated protein n=1 Tax=Vibrio alginolyticus TaxID=663 RepID=UPI003AB54408
MALKRSSLMIWMAKSALYLKCATNTSHQLQDEMGRLATGFSYKINQLQSQGLDLNGKIGKTYLLT